MKIQMFLIALLLAMDSYADNIEVYTPNDAGGFIVLTQEKCQLSKYKESFPYRAYATTNEPNVKHEACYDVPDISQAPKVPGYRVFPIVNFIDVDGIRLEYPLEIFSSSKVAPTL